MWPVHSWKSVIDFNMDFAFVMFLVRDSLNTPLYSNNKPPASRSFGSHSSHSPLTRRKERSHPTAAKDNPSSAVQQKILQLLLMKMILMIMMIYWQI